MSYPERIVPDETEHGIVALHLVRYAFAAPVCVGREVLDAGCGVGYGTAYLGEVASRVVGIDVDPESIAYAQQRYAAANIEFRLGDLRSLGLEGSLFDTVTSFEVIEHVREQEAFLDELARVLRPQGVLVVSTPNVPETNDAPDNPFHLRELSQTDFEAMLRERFEEVELYGQRRRTTKRYETARRFDALALRRHLGPLRRPLAALLGTRATQDVQLDDVIIDRDGLEQATELVAVARRPRRAAG
jgi:2-polyprenyl-3-methyl-5-hydroxy-6-metoxy-1,4-benzoquinol methylase